jgi:hypothetical protein
MNTLRILGAIALSSFIATAALADSSRWPAPGSAYGGTVLCQIASADGGALSNLCALPGSHAQVVASSHLK